MSVWIVSLLVFVGAVAAGIAATLFAAAAPDRPEARVRARIRRLREQRTGEAGAPAAALLKSEAPGGAAWPDRLFANLSVFPHLEDLVRRSKFRFTTGTFLLGSAALVPVATVLLRAFGAPWTVAALFALAAGAAPYLWLRRRVGKRVRRFLEQMPDGLDTISQGLQAGLGLGHAQVFLAEEAPEPMKSEFSIFIQEMNLGLPLRDAVGNLERRVPLHEVRLFSTALLVHREVGGSLSDVLVRLGEVIRDRFRIEQEIRTLTAQNRMTAYVVCALPIVLTFLMFLMNPDFMNEVTQHKVGVTMLTMAVAFWLTGALVFWRLLKIHV